MKLTPTPVSSWPKLAWVASFERGSQEIRVLHGPMVETTEDWIVEAVWAGDFAAGDFDRTDLVFGTGIRVRGDTVDFVSSGTTFDQLWHTTHVGQTYISNSLPALMAVARIGLLDDYPHYRRDIHSIKKGLDLRTKSIATNAGTVSSVYFNNLRLEGGHLVEIPKPDSAPTFECYEDYRSYLFTTADALRENLSSSDRVNRVSMLCSLSSGYDSCATAVVARQAGCTHAVTIKDSTSYWRGSDSGTPVAKSLGLTCTEYSRTATEYPLEETVWAGCAWSGMLNWTLFDYPSPLCLFFTGCHGEKMWDRVDHDHPDPFVRRDIASLGFCELRLHKGVWQCTLPFWGVRHSDQLKKITLSDEMAPWYMQADYDKPIARRLVEEAGVPRALFGQTKKNSVLPDPIGWPRTRSSDNRFRDFLAAHQVDSPSRLVLTIYRRLAMVEHLLHNNLFTRLGIKKRWRPWTKLRATSLVYCWANEQLKCEYAEGLRRSRVGISRLVNMQS